MSDTIDWATISAALRAPFAPDDVEFMAKGKPGPSGKSQVVAYVDARCVQDRLDDVVGAGAWTFEWQPISTDSKGDVSVAKGTLTIHGVAKSDVGTASNFEASLGCVSHALKRAAVQWGIGRYLYDLEKAWIALDNGHISDAALANLRARLPRPDGTPATPAPRQKPVAQPQAPQAVTPAPTPQRQPAPAQRDAGRPTVAPADDSAVDAPPSDQQAIAIKKLCTALKRPTPVFTTYTDASRLIAFLSAEVKREQTEAAAQAAANGHDLHEAFPAGQRGA